MHSAEDGVAGGRDLGRLGGAAAGAPEKESGFCLWSGQCHAR